MALSASIGSQHFVEVVLPLAVEGTFTYRVTGDLEPRVIVGGRVVVQFGPGRKTYSGLVLSKHQRPPGRIRVKDVLSVLDDVPIILPHQIKMWRYISSYYMCKLGEVMSVALPGMLILSSDTRLVRSDHKVTVELPRNAAILLQALEHLQVLNVKSAAEILGIKDPMGVVKVLVDAGALVLEEELKNKFKPITVEHVVLNCSLEVQEERLGEWFDALERAPKQLKVLMKFIELSQCLSPKPRPVRRIELQKQASVTAATIKAMVKKGVLVIVRSEAGAKHEEAGQQQQFDLTVHQEAAMKQVRSGLLTHRVCLLHGVTSSGKTELYVTLIKEALKSNGQVLYLLPEIALTVQMIQRLRDRCGVPVAVYHSRLTMRERANMWTSMLHSPAEFPIVIGARSALLLPFQDLQLIVVDEEHDPSYKQHDPAPRYNARDMAVLLADSIGAKVVLGSATPSLESLHNVEQGKYALAELNEKFESMVLPEVKIADLRDAHKRKVMKGQFTPALLEHIDLTLKAKEQVILFQNRRGYAPVLQCLSCGWIPECDQCDVSLTFHKKDNLHRCHYCGRSYKPILECMACGAKKMEMIGTGTEQIEEQLRELFPTANVARMDQDTTRGKKNFARLMMDLTDGTIDILVGTQMVTKGLDLERVTLVGILNADALMRFPDLRAHERAFQLMAQVAGRAGRRGQRSTVIIQTFEPGSPVIKAVVAHDTHGIAQRELELRKAHFYPPFCRMLRISLRAKKELTVERMAKQLMDDLRGQFGERVLGPEIPTVAWVRGQHIRNIMVKHRKSTFREEKDALRSIITRLEMDKEFRSVRVMIDVDPY